MRGLACFFRSTQPKLGVLADRLTLLSMTTLLPILIALIGTVGTLGAAFFAAHATIRTAELQHARPPAEQTPLRKPRRLWLVAGIFALFVGLLSLIAVYALVDQAPKHKPPPSQDLDGDELHDSILQNALELLASYKVVELDDPRNVRPWQASVERDLLLGRLPESDEPALQLVVDLQRGGSPTRSSVKACYPFDPSEVLLAVAQVYLPDGQPGRDAGVQAALVAQQTGAADHLYQRIGPVIHLSPGVWSPVVWGGGRASQQAVNGGEDLDKAGFCISIWATDASFTGSIFLDDLELYGLSRRWQWEGSTVVAQTNGNPPTDPRPGEPPRSQDARWVRLRVSASEGSLVSDGVIGEGTLLTIPDERGTYGLGLRPTIEAGRGSVAEVIRIELSRISNPGSTQTITGRLPTLTVVPGEPTTFPAPDGNGTVTVVATVSGPPAHLSP